MAGSGGARLVVLVMALAAVAAACSTGTTAAPVGGTTTAVPLAVTALPPPVLVGSGSLEEALSARRSVRSYDSAAVTEAQLGQLLWAAQGTTQPGARGRTAPSAGGTYPLEVYAATAEGVFRYVPEGHLLEAVAPDDRRPALQAAAWGQEWVGEAPLVVVIVGVVARTAERYGDRAERYVILEAGHAAQNLLLQAVALGLGAVPVGAFDDAAVRDAVGVRESWAPLYLIPVGRPAGG